MSKEKHIPKTCILCKHLLFDAGSPDLSEVTPGEEWSCSCDKDHFFMRGTETTSKEYISNLRKAETCKDFKMANYKK